MNQGKNLYTLLCQVDPPQALGGAIVARLAHLRRRGARVRLALQSSVCFLSGLALVPLAHYAGQEFYASGFYEYASLLFSDHTLLVSSWQELAYSLIESLPSLALLLLLAVAAALIWSVRNILVNGKAAFISLPRTAL